MVLEDWMLPRFDMTVGTVSNTTAALEDLHNALSITDCSLWRTKISDKTFNHTRASKSGRASEIVPSDVLVLSQTSFGRKAGNKTEISTLEITECSLWRTRASEMSDTQTTIHDSIRPEAAEHEEVGLVEDEPIVVEAFSSNVLEQSLNVSTTTPRSVVKCPQSENPLEDLPLSVTECSLWRTKASEMSDTPETEEHDSIRSEAVDHQEVDHIDVVVGASLTSNVPEQSLNVSTTTPATPKPVVKRPQPKNPLFKNFEKKSPRKIWQNMMPLDGRRSMAPTTGIPFRNLKRKSSLNSVTSEGTTSEGTSEHSTNASTASETSLLSTPRSPRRKVMNLSKKSSPRLVDRVRNREMIKAAKSYASPTVASRARSLIQTPTQSCQKSSFLPETPKSTAKSAGAANSGLGAETLKLQDENDENSKFEATKNEDSTILESTRRSCSQVTIEDSPKGSRRSSVFSLASRACDTSRELMDSEVSTTSTSKSIVKSRWDTTTSTMNGTKSTEKQAEKRVRQSEVRQSALSMIAKNYETPKRDGSGPLDSMLTEDGALMSGPIQSQSFKFGGSVNPRVLFDSSNDYNQKSAGEFISQPLRSQKSQKPLALLNDSDITLGEASICREPNENLCHIPSDSNFLFESFAQFTLEDPPSGYGDEYGQGSSLDGQGSNEYGSSQDTGFDSTRVLPFAKDSDATGMGVLDDPEDALSSPAPKHLIIAAKKGGKAKEVVIKPPKLVTGSDEFASEHNLRRSTRLRPTRRLNHAAGERLVYSPGGSITGINKGVLRHPLCVKHNTADLAKAFEMDREQKKRNAERRKAKRIERYQRMGEVTEE
ncbi:unnamed protein product [Bursaphelenchus okinawaensis]|uniref:Uncharacterized protein n=1 Tax=Bursaphelenchus okinawaensis TaxID=465554 RepID=A0A811LCD8_9BILA|nr:unnamed protein product [Bursaphelenchus okinawaensis]CAG9121334.1 unnamed protein product [Bursaphelenchus okinawaensis]